jgi:hypothetical protein
MPPRVCQVCGFNVAVFVRSARAHLTVSFDLLGVDPERLESIAAQLSLTAAGVATAPFSFLRVRHARARVCVCFCVYVRVCVCVCVCVCIGEKRLCRAVLSGLHSCQRSFTLMAGPTAAARRPWSRAYCVMTVRRISGSALFPVRHPCDACMR